MQSESEDESWKHAAHRTDEDFYDLRKLLVAATPFIMVPPLPPRAFSTTPKRIDKRLRLYQRFLHAIHKSEIIKTSQIFVDFIKMPDRNEWLNAVKRSQQTKIYSVVQQDGMMNVQPNTHNAEFAEKGKKFAESYNKATKSSINLSKDIYKKSLELA